MGCFRENAKSVKAAERFEDCQRDDIIVTSGKIRADQPAG
jgi:hypothetical protein